MKATTSKTKAWPKIDSKKPEKKPEQKRWVTVLQKHPKRIKRNIEKAART